MSAQETTLRKDTALRMPFPRRGVLKIATAHGYPDSPGDNPTGDGGVAHRD